MKLLVKAATPLVNTLADGLLSTVADSAIVDISDMKRTSIFLNQIGDRAILDLATKTTNVDTIVYAKTAGATPNLVFAAGAAAKAGTIAVVGSTTTVTFKNGVSTVADVEALLMSAASTQIGVLNTGTQVTLLAVTVDEFTTTPLVLGVATFTLTILKSTDGLTYATVTTKTDADMPSGNNVSVEVPLSNAAGMPTLAKSIKVVLTAMHGLSTFSITAAGAAA